MRDPIFHPAVLVCHFNLLEHLQPIPFSGASTSSSRDLPI
uniref:Uncharacterized protein n=1 Tax=Arundo donax TaxID=35708 RepID=A0A0A9EQN4_ARUDO